MITGTLKTNIDKLWETFWTGGISNPMTVIEQITYLMYIKRMDEEQTKMEKKANRLGKPIQNPLFTEVENPLRWSQFKDKDPDVMFDLFRVGVEVAEKEYKNVFDKMKERLKKSSPKISGRANLENINQIRNFRRISGNTIRQKPLKLIKRAVPQQRSYST